MVERCVRDAEAVGSSPVTSTTKNLMHRALRGVLGFLFVVRRDLSAEMNASSSRERETPERCFTVSHLVSSSQAQSRGLSANWRPSKPLRTHKLIICGRTQSVHLRTVYPIRIHQLNRANLLPIVPDSVEKIEKTCKRQKFVLYIIYPTRHNVNRKRFPARQIERFAQFL